MDSIFLKLLTGLIEPLLWIKSMSTLDYNKNWTKYYKAGLGYYVLIVGKGLAGIYINVRAVNILASIILAVYIFVITVLLFGGELREKVIYVCIFFCILFASELIVIGVFSAFIQVSWNTMMNNDKVNFICECISRILQVTGCYCLFNKRKCMNFFYRNQERISLIIVICAMLISIILKSVNKQEIADVVLLFEIIQILFLWYILSTSFAIKKKDKYILDLNQEVSNNIERQELIQSLSHLKHDFSTHVSIMKNLVYYKKYDKLEQYMENVFKEVERAEVLYNHPNITVGILISELIRTAKEFHVPLSVKIQVKEFGMNNEDICAIFKNLVMNGLEAASKVHHEIAHVSLQVLYTNTGYEIRCINECVGVAQFKRTSKMDKRNHGFGVDIIDKIVKKYQGTVERVCEKTDKEEMGLVIVTIQIPLQENVRQLKNVI